VAKSIIKVDLQIANLDQIEKNTGLLANVALSNNNKDKTIAWLTEHGFLWCFDVVFSLFRTSLKY